MEVLFIIAGLFTFLGGLRDWEWFMNHRKARFFVRAFSRNGARGFYMVLGLLVAGMGLLGTLGVIDLSKN